jgi:hypothetical protein
MSFFTGKDGFRVGDLPGAMFARVQTVVKNLGEKISGKEDAADAQAVQELDALTITINCAKEAHAVAVKQRLSVACTNAVGQLLEALCAAADSGSFVKFVAEGQRQAASDATLGLRSPASTPSLGGCSSSSGCLQFKSTQKQLFVHPEGGIASVGKRLLLHKDGPEARLCFRFVPEAPIVAAPASSSRSRSPSPSDQRSDSHSPPPASSSCQHVLLIPDAELDPVAAAAASNAGMRGRIQHVESGLFVVPSKATLPSPLIMIADPAPSIALFVMTPAGHLLHVASSAVICPAKAKVSSGCALELRQQDAAALEHSVFALQPFERYSNGHLILQSLLLTVCRKFRKCARALVTSSFVDPKCVSTLQHASQVSLLAACIPICIARANASLITCHSLPPSFSGRSTS